MTSTGEWTPREVTSYVHSGSWRDLSSRGTDDFTGAVPFDLVDGHGRATPVSMVVQDGTVTALYRSEPAPAALISYSPPLLGPSPVRSTALRSGAIITPLPPFDEVRFRGWSLPSLIRGGTIVICHELTGTIDGDVTAWFAFRNGMLEGVHDREPEIARQTGVPFMKIHTTWLARLRWRLGEISTLEMASGTALRAGSWSALDYALATADRAQAEMCTAPLPLARELRWLATTQAPIG